jgi:hypothetical protein
MTFVGAAAYGATLMGYGGPVRGEIQEMAMCLLRRGHTLMPVK